MVATALLISFSLWFDHNTRSGQPIKNAVINAALTVVAIATAGALCETIAGHFWRQNGYLFPIEPGEWLTALVAFAVFGFVLATAISLFTFFAISHQLFLIVWPGTRLTLLFLLMALCLAVAMRRADTSSWRMVFICLALIAPLLKFIAGAQVCATVLLLAILLAAANDLRRATPRPWMHWFGVLTAVLIVLSCGVISLYPWTEHYQASNWLQ
jgi:hypothetical protein